MVPEKGIFTETEQHQLISNSNVQSVTEKTITYTSAYKLAAVKVYLEGKCR